MAMAQGEQRAVHPFFQQDFGGSTTPVPRTPIGEDLPQAASQVSENQGASNRQVPSNYNIPDSTRSRSPSLQLASPFATLDHDPNTARRKRRKTTQSPTDESGEKCERSFDCHDATVEGVSAPTGRRTPELYHADVPHDEPRKTNTEPQNHDHVVDLKDDTQDQLISGNNDGQGAKRKIIKLNSNGKLLSSPAADRFMDKVNGKKGNKKGKSDVQKPGARSRLVIIRYGKDKKRLEGLATRIDKIMSGETKYGQSDPSTPAPSNATCTAKPQQLMKPTHPFFLKKAVRKAEFSGDQGESHGFSPSQSDLEAPKMAKTSAHPLRSFPLPSLASSAKPTFTFAHHFPRFPEPAQPIWPPRGYIHIRDIPEEADAGYKGINFLVRGDQRKSKTAVITIPDEESVLMSTIHASKNKPRVLRIPKRQVVSGRTLQDIMVEQLSNPPTDSAPNSQFSPVTCHPAVAKLHSSLCSSMTAFDLGRFDTQLWTQKYAPTCAQQVLSTTKEAFMLRDWLKHLVVSSIDTGRGLTDEEKKKCRTEEKKRKRRKKSDKLGGFIISSEDEASEMGEIDNSDDELAGDVTVTSNKRTVIRTGDLTVSLNSRGERGRMSNAILLSGPSGSGKTASVYAVAKELGFEVFEINAGNRRSAKDILERVGDMTQNHLVHNFNGDEGHSDRQPRNDGPQSVKQNKLAGFFQPLSDQDTKKTGREKQKPNIKDPCTKPTRNQKQSLILVEEADILFEEDRQFWSGVLAVINQSKRPIVITCNDETLIPLEDISFHAILRYRTPPLHLAVDYLLLVAANEGHILKRSSIESLYNSTGNDLRRTLMDLGFWCQMAVGSEKSGLDWMLDRWPRGSDLDSHGHPLRVLSHGTYQQYMGWFSRDMLVNCNLTCEVEYKQEAFHWWHLSPQDSEVLEDEQISRHSVGAYASRLELLDDLRHQSNLMDARSALDALTTCCCICPQMDSIDASVPPVSQRQRLNYAEGYQLLHADLAPDFTSLPVQIGSTVEVLIGKVYRQKHDFDLEAGEAVKILTNISKPKGVVAPKGVELREALAPITKADYIFPLPTGRQAPSFENGLKPIVEDLGPYVRGIVGFDLRLEQHRLQLSAMLSRDGKGTKRARTTRASRAALEGGNKADTRKERWFSSDVNPSRILATGNKEWQDVLVRNGHFSMACAWDSKREEDNGQATESSSEGAGI